MRHKIVLTTNIVKFLSALDALRNRGVGEEGMGLLSGRPGEGKTTTISYVVNTHGGIYLRARATWTITRLLRAILQELKLEPSHYRDPMVDQAIASLSEMPRPIFVDEADYLFRKTEMLDVLRDIYDAAVSVQVNLSYQLAMTYES